MPRPLLRGRSLDKGPLVTPFKEFLTSTDNIDWTKSTTEKLTTVSSIDAEWPSEEPQEDER